MQHFTEDSKYHAYAKAKNFKKVAPVLECIAAVLIAAVFYACFVVVKLAF